MSPRTRFLVVFALGFCACLGASWFAVEPLREADDSWKTVRNKLEEQQNSAAQLDPNDPQALERLLEGLEATEQLGEARRDEIANSAAMRILISFLCTGLAYWIAVSVSGRLTGSRRRTSTRSGTRPAVTPRRQPRIRETGCPAERVFIADRGGVLEYVNDTIVRDLGRPRELLVGTSIADLFGGGAQGALGAVLAGFSLQKTTAHVEVSVGDPATPTWIAFNMHARFDENEEIREIVAYGRDVTEERGARDGSEFTGARPHENGADEATGREGPRTLAGAQILVAEAGRDQRRLIDFYLQQVGAQVTMVEDGACAIEAFESTPDDHFDVVVLDRRMPRLDGIEATRALRQRGFEGPIVLLSNQTGPAGRRRFLEGGGTEVARKPIDRRTLIATLSAVLPEWDVTS